MLEWERDFNISDSTINDLPFVDVQCVHHHFKWSLNNCSHTEHNCSGHLYLLISKNCLLLVQIEDEQRMAKKRGQVHDFIRHDSGQEGLMWLVFKFH